MQSSSATSIASSRLAMLSNQINISAAGSKNLNAPKMHKVIVCRDLGPDAMGVLRAHKELELIVWPEDRKCDRGWLLENILGAEGVVLMLSEQVNDELLDKAGPSLKVISTMSVGYEHVILPALEKRGIRLGYTPDVLTDAVADVAILLALMASRNIKATTSLVSNGEWPKSSWAPFGFCGPQISSGLLPPLAHPPPSSASADIEPPAEKVVGFLGFGRIAHATLTRLVAFGIKHFIYSGNPSSSPPSSSALIPSPTDVALAAKHFLPPTAISRVTLETLASNSDILFVLAPGGTATYHIISSHFLSLMKPTALLVNASRGSLVDSDALAAALRDGVIWGAGLDVVEGEPDVGKDHPLVREPRCVVLPHVGSATFETRKAMATLAARNAVAGVLGEKMPAELDLKSR